MRPFVGLMACFAGGSDADEADPAVAGDVVLDAPLAETSREIGAEPAVPAAVAETNEAETNAAEEALPSPAGPAEALCHVRCDCHALPACRLDVSCATPSLHTCHITGRSV